MERDFLLPDVGEGLESATIVDWHVGEGDSIELNQPLVTIETAKAAVELPSPFSGRVTLVNAAAGDELRVGDLLARIDTTERPDALAPSVQDAGGGEGPSTDSTPDATGPRAGTPSQAATQAEALGEAHEGRSGREPVLVGYGTEALHPARRPRQWSRADRRVDGPPPTPLTALTVPTPLTVPTVPTVPTPTDRQPPRRPLARPPVRWLAKSLGVDLYRVQATGPHGEVSRDDVEAAGAEGAPAAAAEWRRQTSGGDTDLGTVPVGALGEELPVEIPVVGIRARIAERMSRSRSQIPEATCGLWVDFDRLLEVRASLDEALGRASLGQAGDDSHDESERPHGELTPFALLAWMVPIALRAAPLLNASFVAESKMIQVHRSVHLGIATSTQHGLVVPVLRQADRRGLGGFAAELARLSRSARDGTLAPNELVGSTFTISNYGALGLDDGNPVINVPEAAILGVGSIARRAAVHDGALQARSTAKLVCAFDHRVCDGAEAARFLCRLKAFVERPELVLAAR